MLKPDQIVAALRDRASAIPQVEGGPPCEESSLLRAAAAAIERLGGENAALEDLVADLGEKASVAGFYARQAEDAAKETGRRAAYIKTKAMQHFDPSYRNGSSE